jgi:hypothetical protein
MISKFFHTPGTRKFNVKPRFYDPDQEEREAREMRIRQELGLNEPAKTENGEYRPNIRGQFRNSDGWQRSDSSAKVAQQRRLLWLILILAVVVFLLFFGDVLF